MVRQVNIAEAKTHLSRLLDEVAAGEEVVIARAGRPVVRLVAIDSPPHRSLGFLPLTVDDAFFAPLDGDELDRWA